MKSVGQVLTWFSSINLMARFEPKTILEPGTVLCHRYTIPQREEPSRHMIWDRVNGVDLSLLNFHTFHTPHGFRKNIDGQDIEFTMSYNAPDPISQVYTKNTVRLNNWPTIDGQDQIYNQFLVVWHINGKPWKKWWLGSQTYCMADDFDDTTWIHKADDVVVYKRRKPY